MHSGVERLSLWKADRFKWNSSASHAQLKHSVTTTPQKAIPNDLHPIAQPTLHTEPSPPVPLPLCSRAPPSLDSSLANGHSLALLRRQASSCRRREEDRLLLAVGNDLLSALFRRRELGLIAFRAEG